MSMSYDDDNADESESSQPNRHLDADFDKHLANMKKHIQDLKDRKCMTLEKKEKHYVLPKNLRKISKKIFVSAKQLCALWIKKLCESNDSLVAKTIRNEYSSKLLRLLENYEVLKFPFSERPPTESLKPYVRHKWKFP